MNRNCYRLVFNRQRNAWLAVAETVRGRNKKSNRSSPTPAAAVLLGLAMAVAGSALAGPTIPAANALPVPSSGSRPFVFAGSVNGGQPSVSGNAMTITTPSRALGLNWASFNIGSDASLTFNQPDATSRVLNRIWSADPSVIMGRLKANGEVYLINQNGILFGNGAQVNVGGLVASALNLSDSMASQLLNSGMPSVRGDRLEFAWDGSAAGFNAGFVTLDAGAKVTTPSGGRVLLIAPKTTENLGLIEGGGGAEAILAAGGKVILTAPNDPNLRGLLVETKSFTGKDALGNSVRLDGSATNQGTIDSGSGGVVTLAALAVNQKGMVKASKAVNLNGTTMLVSGTNETGRLTINQRGDQAEIDWVSGFNVGVGKTVEFVQHSTGSVAYNYVHDADRTAADGSILNVAGRSSIDGILKASGQLFLINEKGFDFGAGADVKAANFVASALGVSSSLVRDGIFAQDVNSRAFYLSKNQLSASDATAFASTAANAQAAFDAATITISPGANISTSVDNGFVMLIGSRIDQSGTISTPRGQTLLAAGADVYLKPPFAAGLRGFMAEVNPLYVVRTFESNAWGVIDHGTVTNSGSVSAALGNVSLVGFNINQQGILWASTSATANGSIRLLARDQLAEQGLAAAGEEPLVATGQRNINAEGVTAYVVGESYNPDNKVDQPLFTVGRAGGNLTLVSGSVSTVQIDGSGGKTIAADQTFITSQIDLIGKKVDVHGSSNGLAGAQLEAHGGRIQALASETFDLTLGFAGDPVAIAQTLAPTTGVGVFVGDGAKLDVSGVTAKKSVSDLFIEVELRGDEFANNTVQRNSKLRGKTAWVDSREGVKIADLSGWFGRVGQSVEEKAASGGTISLKTSGSLIFKPNAELNVSGGGVEYEGGTVTESRVFSIGGYAYRLNDAPATAIYYGIRDRQRKLADYYEGRSAGTLDFAGHSLAVDGNLIANTTRGALQRNISTSSTDHYAVPLGGKLIIQDGGQHFPVSDRDTASDEEKNLVYAEAQIAFIRGAANASAGLEAGDSAGQRLELSQTLVDAGFSRFDIRSDGRIDIDADVSMNLAPGGEFKLSGRQIDVAGKVSVPNGKISLTTRDMSRASGLFPTLFDAKYSTLIVERGGRLSTSGQWVNDYLDRKVSQRKPKATSGGSISLVSAYDIDLREGSELNVSGGALVNPKGKLEPGDAGSIVLSTGGIGSAGGFDFTTDLDRRDASLFLDGSLVAYALGSGGSLEINTSAAVLGEHFAEDSRDWTRSRRLAENQVGVALTSDFFNKGGFFDFKLAGRDGVTVNNGTRIAAQPLNWSLLGLPGYRRKASGSELTSFAASLVLPPELRNSTTDLTLATRSLEFGNLLVGDSTYLGVSPKGSINLESWAQLTMLGSLEAPAGSIKLSRPANPGNDDYNVPESFGYSEAKQSASIYLGANSRLLAGGTSVLHAATRRALDSGVAVDSLRERRRYKGEVIAGGKVDVDAGLGYLITAQGSSIDVSGAVESLNTPSVTSSGGLSYAVKTLGSAGGRVSFAAQEGMFLDGTYQAEGKNGAPDGIFSLSLYKRLSNETWYSANSSDLPATITGPRQLTVFQSAGSPKLQWHLNAEDTVAYLAGQRTLPSADYNGKAALDIASLAAGQFGSWYLNSRDEIRFDGNLEATVNNQLRLDASKFSATGDATRLAFTAAVIQLGSYAASGAPVTAAVPGGAEATFNAHDIGISGNFTWNGFAVSQFSSRGEIHFDSTVNSAANRTGGRNFSGQMTASGDLGFASARLSPSTYSDYRVDLASDASSRIAITRQVGSVAGESLAAGGRLEFAARTIDHSGTVTAPLGEIVFNAPGGTVTLGETSVTSVAADQTMMLGQADQSGRYWQFRSTYLNPQSKVMESATYTVAKAPEKAIRIDAANSVVKSGATLDLSAGGEAIAAEFTPGPGGKTDILAISPASTEAAANTTAKTVFAVLPGWNGQFAPQDSQAMGYYNVSSTAIKASDGSVSYRYDSVPTLKAGDQVQLATNGSGLAAGTYTLLPANYALLPGAYLVSVKATNERVVARSRRMTDGGWLANGSILAANSDGTSSPYSQSALTFEVASPSLVDSRAKYKVSRLSEFFYDTAGNRSPGDVGQLTVIGRNSVAFDPSIVAMRQAEISAADGRKRSGEGLQLDIAAPRLAISDGVAAPAATWSVLDQDKLIALGATSVLLGGSRSNDGDVTKIDTIASQVLVQNDGVANATQALIGPELMLTALDELKIAANSQIESAGQASGRKVVLAGDGAFLRVAEGEQASLSRSGIVPLNTGSLVVEAGATVAGKSMILDATRNDKTRNTLIDGTLLLGALQADGSRSGGYLTIGAGRINVVGDGSTPSDGLTLLNNDLARFAQADQLRLTSYTTVDLFGNAMLGTAELKELVIGAAGIAGHGGVTSTISGQSVVFDNPNPDPKNTTFENAGLGNGILNVNAGTLTFGSNVDVDINGVSTMRGKETRGFAMRGFAQVNLAASGDLRFAGKGVTAIDNAADNGLTGADKVLYGGNGATTALSINAGRVVTLGTADHLLIASGKTDIAGGMSGGSALLGLNGSLEVRAKAIDVSGRIETPSGSLSLTATGTDSSDNVTIKNNAVIAAEGSKMAFADTYAYAPGGQIKLTSAKGNVSIDTGTIVSVAADAGGGDAGTLSLVAMAGNVSTAAGTLYAKASTNDASLSQGSLKIDAGSVSLDELADAVTETLGDGTTRRHFGGQWDIRSRTGDLALTKSIVAENVAFAADNGGISVGSNGKIDASGAKGGTIGLHGRNGDVVLAGQLIARGTELVANTSNAGTRGQGGDITLSTSGIGKVVTSAGSTIDVGVVDGSTAAGGKVIFRAAESLAIANSDDLNIQLAGGTIRGASDVSAEIVSTYSGTSLATGNSSGTTLGLTGTTNSIQKDLNTDYSAVNLATLRGHLGFDSPLYHVRPGVEITSSSTDDFNIAADLNFGLLRFQGEAGVLTLRAQGNLNINGTLTDGFIANGTNNPISRDAKLNTSGNAWSYRLIAGADTTAAAPLATRVAGTQGSLQVAANKLVRTGKGSIDMAASKDIKLLDRAAVYTAGIADTAHPSGFLPIAGGSATSSITSTFPDGGGDITLTAGERILMVSSNENAPDQRHINQWMFRAGGEIRNLQWWPRMASFQQGVAAFGGGDITLSAGNEIKNFTAAIPTNGRVPTSSGERQPDLAKIQGGGDLIVRAGGSVNGGLFYAESGRLLINAAKLEANVGIALGNSPARIVSDGDVTLGNIFNPMWTKADQYVFNTGSTVGFLPDSAEYRIRIGTYGEQTALDLLSVSGDVALNGNDQFYQVIDRETHLLAPARVKVAALNGDISGSLMQAPGNFGQLDLLAAGSITLGTASVKQLDLPANVLPSLRNPIKDVNFELISLLNSAPARKHTATSWHDDDNEPSRLIALRGDIAGQSGQDNYGDLNEALRVQAGGDIRDLNLTVQHQNPDNMSSLAAGGEILYTVNGGIFPSQGIKVNGPGRLELIVGGSVDLGDSKGIVSKGNLENPYLPVGGADILVMAGTTSPDYAGFLKYLQDNGLSVGSDTSPEGLRDRFYTLLRDFGNEAVSGGGEPSYEKGREAIRALLPASAVSIGNIDLFYSAIKTEQGGRIDLLAPGGGVTVGIANPSSTIPKKKAADQGLFTFRGGDIRAFVRDNFLVNQSRVFTLDGGNILVWADRGSIDAGTGAKTVSATPPPVLVVRDGQIFLDASNSVSGSGIGALASRDTSPISNIDLFAPQGAIDAGDAGLRSSGNITLGAQTILNASNIQAAGTVSGAPAPAASAAPAPAPTSPTNTDKSEAQAASALASNRETPLGVLTVEVLESGEAVAEPAAEKDEEKKKKR